MNKDLNIAIAAISIAFCILFLSNKLTFTNVSGLVMIFIVATIWGWLGMLMAIPVALLLFVKNYNNIFIVRS